MKKSKADKYYSEEKINRWTDEIKTIKESIRDRASQIAGGFVDLPSNEFYVLIRFINKEIEMIEELQALIDEENDKCF